MRKFFSLIAAVLFAGSMMAADATMAAGTNGSACTVNGVAGIKCGTSSKGGDMTITVGAGATKLSFYAAAWNNVSGLSLNLAADGVTFSPASVSLTADAGISNNSPFTLVGSAEAFKFEVDLTGVSAETTIAVTSSTAKRFVVWGASYETGEVPPTPADTYTVAGSDAAIFGEAWNPALEANDMTLTNGIYKWEKAELDLTAGDIEFKVVKNHSWDVASYPANNYVLNIAEDGEYTITITFDPATETVAAEAVKKEPLADPTNCAEAAEAALSVSANNELYNNGAVYTIEGYVTGIKTAYSDQYHNISFWMADAADGGEVLQAYRAACASEADAPAVGDKVAVTGTLTKYGTTPEFAAGCTYVITEPYIPVEPTINYYVIGSMTEWNVEANYKLVANPAVEGEYMGEFTFANNDEFKIAGDDGSQLIWYPDGMDNNFQITEAGDYKITFNPAGNVDGWYYGFFNVVKKEALADPTNCAEAAAAALSVSANNELYNNGAVYTIEGYVTGIKTAYSDQYHNISFWMADAADGGEVLQAYRAACASEADAPAVGDKVAVTGSLTKYGTTPEFAAACTYVILERATPVAPADTIVIDIENEVQYVDYVAEEGWWQFMAENDVYSISISNLSTTQAAGTYTVADLDAKFSYVFRKADSLSIAFVDGSLTLTEGEDGSRTIEGVMTGDDGNIYNIKLVFRIPTAETTVNVEIPEWALVDASKYYGFAGYILAGETADKSIYVQLVIPGSNPLGTFTYDDLYAGGTGIEVAGDYKGIYSIDLTVTAGGTAGEERAFITADILCLNNTLYHVTTLVGEGVDAIEAAEQAVKRIVNGQVVIEKAGKTYNMNGAVIR